MNSRKKYDVKCNFLNYLQVLSAILKHLLQKARTLPSIDKRNLLHSTLCQLSPSITILIDLAEMCCEGYLTIIRRRRSKYSPIFAKPEANNCFGIILRCGHQKVNNNKKTAKI